MGGDPEVSSVHFSYASSSDSSGAIRLPPFRIIQSWCEKYRPRTFRDLVGNKNVIQEIQECLSSASIYDMLFVGPSGVGKTTIAKNLVPHILFEEEEEGRSRTMFVDHVNPSQETAVTKSIQEFCYRWQSVLPRHRCLVNSLIVIEEAHTLPKTLFPTLLQLMSMPDLRSLFIFLANSDDNIDPAAKDRCHTFEFSQLAVPDLHRRASEIIEKERFDLERVDDRALRLLVENANGDMRRVLRVLQSGFPTLTYDHVALSLDIAHPRSTFPLFERLLLENDTKRSEQETTPRRKKGAPLLLAETEEEFRELHRCLVDLFVADGSDLRNILHSLVTWFKTHAHVLDSRILQFLSDKIVYWEHCASSPHDWSKRVLVVSDFLLQSPCARQFIETSLFLPPHLNLSLPATHALNFP